MRGDDILRDRYAFVTGATRGIGRAVAETLGKHGCNVAVISRKAHDAVAVSQEIARGFGVETIGKSCDISRLADVHALFKTLRHWSADRLDILVCNAGYPFVPEIWETLLHDTPLGSLEAWYTDVYRTDTLGSVFCTYEALPLMMPRKSGSIIYIASTPALEGYRGSPYTVAKAGILGLMRDVALEYGKYNIRANALALGNINSPATLDHLTPETQTGLAYEAPLRRWGNPEEVGRVVLFLASNLSSFVTGQTIVVDGGTLRR